GAGTAPESPPPASSSGSATANSKSPYSSAVVLPRITRDLGFFLDEHAREFPGIRVVALPERNYPSASIGGEFLGLLGEISPSQLAAHTYRGQRAGAIVGQSGAEAG